jgi:hypothetical protein
VAVECDIRVGEVVHDEQLAGEVDHALHELRLDDRRRRVGRKREMASV